jgi:hypothetical protein
MPAPKTSADAGLGESVAPAADGLPALALTAFSDARPPALAAFEDADTLAPAEPTAIEALALAPAESTAVEALALTAFAGANPPPCAV